MAVKKHELSLLGGEHLYRPEAKICPCWSAHFEEGSHVCLTVMISGWMWAMCTEKKKRLSPIEGFPSCNCNFYPSFLFFCFVLGWVGLGFFDWSLNYSQLLCLSGLWLKDWSSGLHTTPHVLLLVLFVTLEAWLYIIQEGRNQENMLFDVHVQITVLPHYRASFPQTVSRCKKHIGLHIREAYQGTSIGSAILLCNTAFRYDCLVLGSVTVSVVNIMERAAAFPRTAIAQT